MRRMQVTICFLALVSVGFVGCSGWWTVEEETAPTTLQAFLEMKYGDEILKNPSVAQAEIQEFTQEPVKDIRWKDGKLTWNLTPIMDQVTEGPEGVPFPSITGVPAVDIPAFIAFLLSVVPAGLKIEKKRKARKAKAAAKPE